MTVPDMTKSRWPVHITDALGIPAIRGRGGPWQSTGDTIDVSWFHAMCDYLGIPYPGQRIRAMQAIIESAGGTWDQGRHSSAVEGKVHGGNVRKEAFEDLWDALDRSGYLDGDRTAAASPDALTNHSSTSLPEPVYTYRHIRLRQGQVQFRRGLLRAYGGRCAISGTDARDVLEAAHIVPHGAGGTTDLTNGLLLRADLHTLFDLGRLGLDTTRWSVVVDPQLRQTAYGESLVNLRLRLPEDVRVRPSTKALDAHRFRAGL